MPCVQGDFFEFFSANFRDSLDLFGSLCYNKTNFVYEVNKF